MPTATKQPTKSVIGMIHLAALPGSPLCKAPLDDVIKAAVNDARALSEGGCSALMLENFGDAPFFPGRVPHVTATSMTAVAQEVRRAVPSLPLGINVLRNDGVTAMAIATAVGAAMVRVNVLCGARVTDQGIVQGIAHDLLRERQHLEANVAIWADVDVKHSAPLAPRPLENEVKDTLLRGLADAVIVSGSGTGVEVDMEKLAVVKRAAGDREVLIGSGATAANVASLARHADGFIVGTAFKKGGVVTAPVDPARVAKFISSLS